MVKPIDTAPKDGRKLQVQWRDRDGVENTSIATYRADADPSQSGWWVAVDADTLKRVQPHSWADADAEDDDQ
ncbi:MAG: hypothetical protein AB7S80_12660 [Rhizobiaceae bacterium]